VQQVQASHRVRMPDTRQSLTGRFTICNFEVFISVGFYDDGTTATLDTADSPGEVFVRIAKEGTEVAGLFETICIMVSIALQHGVPWSIMRDHMLHQRFGEGDGVNTSLVDGFAKATDSLIEHRKAAIKALKE